MKGEIGRACDKKERESGWISVSHKRKNEHSQARGNFGRDGNITNFFFTKFSKDIAVAEIKRKFLQNGEFVDIFISRQKSKKGNRLVSQGSQG